MKNLRGYTGGQRPNNSSGNNSAEELLKNCGIEEDALKKYSSMDEDGLIAELIKNVAAQKKNGTYNPEQMAAFINIMSPSLTPEQREKLTNLVRVINDGE